MSKKKLEYRKYNVSLSIGYPTATRKGTIDPTKDLTEKEWNEMSRDSQDEWLQDLAENWADNHIEICWE